MTTFENMLQAIPEENHITNTIVFSNKSRLPDSVVKEAIEFTLPQEIQNQNIYIVVGETEYFKNIILKVNKDLPSEEQEELKNLLDETNAHNQKVRDFYLVRVFLNEEHIETNEVTPGIVIANTVKQAEKYPISHPRRNLTEELISELAHEFDHVKDKVEGIKENENSEWKASQAQIEKVKEWEQKLGVYDENKFKLIDELNNEAREIAKNEQNLDLRKQKIRELLKKKYEEAKEAVQERG